VGLGGAHVTGSLDTHGNFTLTGSVNGNVTVTALGFNLLTFNMNADATLGFNSGVASLGAHLTISTLAFGILSGQLDGGLTVTPAPGGGVVFAANGSVSGSLNLGAFHPTTSASFTLVNNQIAVNLPAFIPFTINLNFPQFPGASVTQNAGASRTVTLKGHIAEPDPTSPFFLVVNWGDGTPAQTFVFPPGSDKKLVQLRHHYRQPSRPGHPYQVDVQWHDNKGAGNAVVLPVTVR
jgi:hypothetical protein